MNLLYYKIIANSFIKEFELSCKIHFKNIRRGRATPLGYVSIPLWALTLGEVYFIYYILHELCHQIEYKKYGVSSHDNNFKNIEKALLNRFNIKIEYKKVYPKRLIKGNKVVYQYKKLVKQ